MRKGEFDPEPSLYFFLNTEAAASGPDGQVQT